MMTKTTCSNTLLLTHPDCLAHDPGPEHPERPARLAAVLEALEARTAMTVTAQNVIHASSTDLERVHGAAYLQRVRSSLPRNGLWNLDTDTVMSPRTLDAAAAAAGAVCAGIDAVCAGLARNAFCAVRPPGHHAERDHALGFCIFNNLAVGAMRARMLYGCRRIAIVDFDAHHGNGAQNIFWEDPETLLVSLHEWSGDMPTGAADETGAVDNIWNIPLSSGSDGAALRSAVVDQVTPRLRHFRPDLLLVAAGFDGHHADPIANLQFETDDYRWIGERLRLLADELCDGRLVASLEGGYNLSALADSVVAFVEPLNR